MGSDGACSPDNTVVSGDLGPIVCHNTGREHYTAQWEFGRPTVTVPAVQIILWSGDLGPIVCHNTGREHCTAQWESELVMGGH